MAIIRQGVLRHDVKNQKGMKVVSRDNIIRINTLDTDSLAASSLALLLTLNCIVNFASVDGNFLGGLDTETNFVFSDADDNN
jgi:uncharacterized membrane-anchored protein